jgi:hypothetical protein
VKRTGFSAPGDKSEKSAESVKHPYSPVRHRAHKGRVMRGFSTVSRLSLITKDCVAERAEFELSVPWVVDTIDRLVSKGTPPKVANVAAIESCSLRFENLVFVELAELHV